MEWKFWRRKSRDLDLDEEIAFDLAAEAEERVQSGMSPEEAERASRKDFGNVLLVTEVTREMWGWRWLERLGQDLRYGLRLLRRSPGFTAAAVLTFALGIGAATAGFSIVNTVVLRPLPFPDSERVMTVLSTLPSFPSPEGGTKPHRPMEYLYAEWRERVTGFDVFAGSLPSRAVLSGVGDPREVAIGQVSSGFFRVAGVQPVLGRVFSAEEDRDGRDSVALLDESFWHREFAADPAVLGRTVVLKERPFTIVGILPAELRFAGFGAADIWVPLAAKPSLSMAGRGGILAIGRLRPGVTREAAQAEMEAITRQLDIEHPQWRLGAVVVKPLQEWIVGETRGRFFMLLGAAAFLLLIVCANVANLMLARGTSRSREMAIRASLGAARKRLAAQMLTESVLLAAIGGALGVALAFAAVRAAPAIRAIQIPRAEEIVVDRTFLLIACAVSLASGVLSGLAPAVQAWRRDLTASFHRDSSAGGRSGKGVLGTLAAAQLALAMVLLAGAGLMTNTLVRLLNVDLGFNRSNVLNITVFLPFKAYDRAGRAAFLRQVAEEVRRMPGVSAVSVANNAPLTEVYGDYSLSYDAGGEQRKVAALSRDVDPGYFRTLGVELLAGRDFEPADATRKPVPLILNMTAARMLFGRDDPLGKLVYSGRRDVGMMQVVGIAGDLRMLGIRKRPGPQAYAALMGGWGSPWNVMVRAAVKPAALAPAIRTVVQGLDSQVPPPKVATLDDAFAERSRRRDST